MHFECIAVHCSELVGCWCHGSVVNKSFTRTICHLNYYLTEPMCYIYTMECVILILWNVLHIYYGMFYLYTMECITSILCNVLHLYYGMCYIYTMECVTSILWNLLHLYFGMCYIYTMECVTTILWNVLQLYYGMYYIYNMAIQGSWVYFMKNQIYQKTFLKKIIKNKK